MVAAGNPALDAATVGTAAAATAVVWTGAEAVGVEVAAGVGTTGRLAGAGVTGALTAVGTDTGFSGGVYVAAGVVFAGDALAAVGITTGFIGGVYVGFGRLGTSVLAATVLTTAATVLVGAATVLTTAATVLVGAATVLTTAATVLVGATAGVVGVLAATGLLDPPVLWAGGVEERPTAPSTHLDPSWLGHPAAGAGTRFPGSAASCLASAAVAVIGT